MWRRPKKPKKKIYIYIENPQTQQSKTRGVILLFSLTEHKALMGRRLGKSNGSALGKSNRLAASGRGDGSARGKNKIKGRGWASIDLGQLEEERKNKGVEVEDWTRGHMKEKKKEEKQRNIIELKGQIKYHYFGIPLSYSAQPKVVVHYS